MKKFALPTSRDYLMHVIQEQTRMNKRRNVPKPLTEAIILALFGDGEEGGYYDPYDLTDEKLAWVAANPSFTSAQFMAQFPQHTLFQDEAGTIPVTGHSQPVGLVLDKSGRGNHASQSLSASRPLWQNNGGLKSFYFDGFDDYLVTVNPMDLSGTSEVSVFAGVMKESDSSTGILIDTTEGVSPSINTNYFNIIAPSSSGANSYRFETRSNEGAAIFLGTGVFAPAPHSGVLSANINRVSGLTEFNVNNEHVFTETNSNIGGNGGNNTLTIGTRLNSSFFYQGHIYSLIIRSTLTPEDQADKIQQLLATRSGVTL